MHDLAAALQEWQALLGTDRVDSQAAEQYRRGTEGHDRAIAAVLRPADAERIPDLVRIAARYRIPLYPISTGHNWGYGTAKPVTSEAVILDLGALNRIVLVDGERGLVSIEPGVTQAQLSQYLLERELPYMVPVTGAGPSCSLLANALERGYGITPHIDHFGAVTSLEAVLADGSLYRRSLAELGGADVDASFKWGLGPYLDGLFSQSGFGIVTRMTLALAPKPDALTMLFFSFGREEDLARAVELVHTLHRRFRGVIGAVNLLNRRRMLSMLEPYPRDAVAAGEIIPESRIEAMAERHRVFPWTGLCAFYGDQAVVAAATRAAKRLLRPHTVRLLALSPSRIETLQRIAAWLPGSIGRNLRAQLDTLNATTDILLGVPREVALPLAYWRTCPAPASDLNPARDGCGLLWFAPLVPLRQAAALDYVALATRIMTEHGIEPLITLTCFSELCADSTVPILFDGASAAEAERAWACYWALYEACAARGYLPYRLNTEHQRKLAEKGELWQVAGRLKRALDPHDIIAPGRYSPLRQANVPGPDNP